MKIAILDKVVRNNIALFQHLIKRFLKKRKLQYLTAKKAYKAFLNCKTGQLKFADLEEIKQLSNEWKPVIIQLHSIENEEGVFEVVAVKDPKEFPYKDLNAEAHMRLARTIHILNQISFDPKRGKNLDLILRRIAQLSFEFIELEEHQKNIIYEAWHNVDRIEAENLLKNSSVGTYLFRKDIFAQTLEEELNKKFSEPVICITLTFKELEEKVSDKTLVYKNGIWLIYNDDPTLEGRVFSTVKDIISIMKNVKKPLL